MRLKIVKRLFFSNSELSHLMNTLMRFLSKINHLISGQRSKHEYSFNTRRKG